MALQVEPCGQALGAVVEGLDLSRPVPEATARQLRSAWWEHLVLFVHGGVDADLAQLRHLAEVFGRPAEVLDRDDGQPDPTYLANPPIGSVLALSAAARPAVTTWTNLYRAHHALSAPVQRFIEGLFGEHVGPSASQRARHPLVRTHPDTGHRALWLSRVWLHHITGIGAVESRRILDLLSEHASREELVTRVRWSPGDIAVWDNRCVLHDRLAGDTVDPAHRRRVRIAAP